MYLAEISAKERTMVKTTQHNTATIHSVKHFTLLKCLHENILVSGHHRKSNMTSQSCPLGYGVPSKILQTPIPPQILKEMQLTYSSTIYVFVTTG